MAECEYCGKELKPQAKFCEHCGGAISSTETLQADAAPPAQDTVPTGDFGSPAGAAPPQQGSYQPPAGAAPPQQGSYQPPAGDAPPQQGSDQVQPQQGSPEQRTSVKQGNPPNKRRILFGGIAVVVIALLAVAVIFGGGGKNKADSSNPFVGVWRASSVEMWGEEFTALEVFDGEVELELKANGTCEFRAEGSADTYRWEENSKEILVTTGGETVFTCVKYAGRLAAENFMDTGMTIIFEKTGGLSAGQADLRENKEGTPAQQKWNGTWYGYFYFSEAYGEWSSSEDELYDAYMMIDVDDAGDGTMTIDILVEGEVVGVVNADIFADETHFEVTDGVFWDYDLNTDVWWLATSPVDEGQLIVISDVYWDPELSDGDGFEYIFQFRPWGELWEQEAKQAEQGKPGSKLPPGYFDYLSEIENNAANSRGSEGNSGSLNAATGNAGLPEGSFQSASEEFRNGGITVLYPNGAEAAPHMFGGVTVDLGGSGWITANMEPQFESFEELYDMLQGYLTYKDAQLYRSTYDDYDCIVLLHDRDEDYDADATISIYVYIEDGQRVAISGMKLGGVLERMLADQNFLAVLENITW